MSDIDYSKWVHYVKDIFGNYGVSPVSIVDLACGTGSIAIPLSLEGYKVTGIDLSEDMLFVAKEKARRKGLNIPFVCQDMRELNLHHPVDAVISMCDGFNYILEEEELEDVLSRIYSYLNPNGILVFDISSIYKLSSVLGNNTMADNGDNVSFIWNNTYDKDEKICQMDLSFFTKEGSLYRRFDETHFQRGYEREMIEELLRRTGYRRIESYHPFTLTPPKKRAHRIFFAAQKLGRSTL